MCDWCGEAIAPDADKWMDDHAGLYYHDYCGAELREELRNEAAALLGDRDAYAYDDDWDGSQALWDRR
jgi:hypothetical protein